MKIKDYEVPFDDGNVIIYVNGSYDGDDEIGHLMSDFRNKTLYGFYNKEIEDAVRHFKTTEGGRENMCDAVQEFAERYAKEYAKDQYSKGADESLLSSVRNVMKNLKVSAEQAMQTIGIPESDYNKYLSRL